MTRPEGLHDWARLLRQNWERRARSGSRDFFVASHAGWDDPATWRRYAETELQLMLAGIDREQLAAWHVLEIGCGSGRLAELLDAIVCSYTGIDIAPAMVDAARQRCASASRCRFLPCNGISIPAQAADRRYQLVLAIAVFIHCPREVIASMVTSAWPLLAPGGELRFQVLADPTDPTGVETPAASAIVAEEVEAAQLELSDEMRRLTEGAYYLGDRFRHDQVEPFFGGLTGGTVSTYRADLGSIYGRIRMGRVVDDEA